MLDVDPRWSRLLVDTAVLDDQGFEGLR
jgi:hypothetical protein